MVKHKAKALLLLAIFSGSFLVADAWAGQCYKVEDYEVSCGSVCEYVFGEWRCGLDATWGACCYEGDGDSCYEQAECPECDGTCGF